MTPDSDVVLIGAGHKGNGQRRHTWPRRPHRDLLQKREGPGGGATMLELTQPGFLHDPSATGHHIFQLTPLRPSPGSPVAVPHPWFWKTWESIPPR